MKWGEKIDNIKDMKYLRTDPSYGGVKIYARDTDELKIGAANLKSITYGFFNDKFASVTIEVNGYTNWAGLKDATFEKFGSGDKANRYIESYIWGRFNGWDKEISGMMLRYNEIKREGILYLFSNEIRKEMKDYEQNKAKEGAQKGF